MQLLIVDGRLGKDAEVKVSQNGDKYLKFSLANRVYKNGEEDTVWYDVITSKPEFLNKLPEFLKKGSYVIVNGPLSVTTRIYEGSIYTNLTIRPNSIEFGGGGKRNDEEGTATTATATPTVPTAPQVAPVAPQATPANSAPQGVFTPPVTMPTPAAPQSVGLTDDAEDDLPF